jgi:hypothetical protein
LAKLERWTGSENLHRTKFDVPAIIVAYNVFMNSVDRMDQRRSRNPTRRVEKRLHMSLFTLFLDLAVHNAYALFKKIDPQKANSTAYREFKRIVAEQLVSPLVAEAEERSKKKEKAAPKASPAVANGVLGSTTGTVHLLLENKRK